MKLIFSRGKKSLYKIGQSGNPWISMLFYFILKGDQKLPKDENYSEMICSNCCEKYHSVLNPYLGLSVERVSKADDSLNTSVVVEEPSGSG